MTGNQPDLFSARHPTDLASVETEITLPSGVRVHGAMQPLPTLDPATAPPDELWRIVRYLDANCHGPQHLANSRAIAEAVGMTGANADRKVRNLISCYQDKLDIPIVGEPGRGFYIATEAEQLDHYDAYLYSLVKAAAARLGAFRRNAARAHYHREGKAPNAKYTLSIPQPTTQETHHAETRNHP